MYRFPQLHRSRLPFALMTVLGRTGSVSLSKTVPRAECTHADPTQRMSRIFALAALLCVAGLAGGQVNPGTPSWSAYDSHQVDTINLQNLNIVMNVPIMSKAGAIPFSENLAGGDSYVYAAAGNMYPGIMAQPLAGTVNGVLGWTGTFAAPALTLNAVLCPNGTTYTTEYVNWYIQFADGTQHWLPGGDYTDSAGCWKASFTDQVIDGTGYTLSVTGNTINSIYGRSGTNIGTTGLSITDPNGSSIKWDGNVTFTDTLGLTALSGYPSTAVTWSDISGTSPSTSNQYTYYYLKSSFACPGKTDFNNTSETALLTSILFPDNRSLSWAFEPNGTNSSTGRISGITLRAGGTIAYNYNPLSGANQGLNCTYGIPNQITRASTDGTTTYTWAPVSNGNNNWGNTTTVVDQGGNKTVYTFTGLTSSGNAETPITQALTQVRHYQGSSTLLTTDLYCYNGVTTGCAIAVVSLPITEVDVYHTINGMSAPSRQQTKYDNYGNITYSAQYDFGASTATLATTTAYGSSNGSGSCSAIGNHVNNKPCTIITTQGGATVGYKQFTYDSHGNVLKTYVSPNGGTSFLSNSTNNSYNSNGTPSVTYDLANNPTTYSYNSASYVSCGSCTQFPFPTSITNGGLTTSSTWNGIGGVKVTDKDASGNTTTYGYTDPWNRVTSIQDPLGNTVNKSYSATTLASTFSFGSSVNNTTKTTDGYGRPINSQTQQGPTSSNYDTVSTAYNWSGNYRTVATSQPCTTTSGLLCSRVHTNYMDPLGRLHQESTTSNETRAHTYTQNDDLAILSPAPSGENVKQVQKEYDGLGRLTKSCAIGNGSSTACGQNTGTANGVPTSTSYTSGTGYQTTSSTRGSQTRSQTVDGLGRVTSTTTPEAGTTKYLYDSGSACGGSYPGQLVQKTFPTHYECYLYDSRGRVTDVEAGYTGSGTTFCRRFRFDGSNGVTGTLPSGISPQNRYGRMVEAETDNCTAPISPITDEWFSYDKDGRKTDIWQLTPHSGTYYHSVATFAGNGVPLTVQLANPSLYTMTYGLDGEGRSSTLKGDTTTIVAGTTFNASGRPTDVDLGTGTDQSDYVYDPNTGRMTNWTFEVGSASETGVLTWNANGTLRQVAIVDGFSSGGSQTCTFGTSSVMGYDDLGRLLSDNCGSVWAQTFSYDQYDNVTKSGSVTWNPGYNSANNRYSTGASYDSSGNLTWDTIHTYVWDQYGKVSSIDSSACGTNGECVTYDAQGRLVESSYDGVYTEIWYTQLGKGVYMKGNSPYYAYWPTPGNGTVEVNGNAVTFYYMHKDWLGNSRISSVIVNPTVVSDQAYAPYGEAYNKQATGAGVPGQMFTEDTQDIVSGIWDTPNRELNASQGRWLSPDPAGAGWNLYAYATNPNSFVDLTGMNLDNTCAGAEEDCTGDGGGDGGDGGGGTLNINFSAGATMLSNLATSQNPTNDFNIAEINSGSTSSATTNPDFSGTLSFTANTTVNDWLNVAPQILGAVVNCKGCNMTPVAGFSAPNFDAYFNNIVDAAVARSPATQELILNATPLGGDATRGIGGLPDAANYTINPLGVRMNGNVIPVDGLSFDDAMGGQFPTPANYVHYVPTTTMFGANSLLDPP